ncbi:hypothetical protein YDYSY3_06690 [Paenibacillus chitinolyticus]|nr:hypothetical protein YDYSY3_06690 [Paenibacillus chitinolyticus]
MQLPLRFRACRDWRTLRPQRISRSSGKSPSTVVPRATSIGYESLPVRSPGGNNRAGPDDFHTVASLHSYLAALIGEPRNRENRRRGQDPGSRRCGRFMQGFVELEAAQSHSGSR